MGFYILSIFTGLGRSISTALGGDILEGIILLSPLTIGAAVGYLWFSRRPIDPRWTLSRAAAVVWVELVGLLVAPFPGILGAGLLTGRTRLHGTLEVSAPLLGLVALAITCAAAAAGPLLATRFRRSFATRAIATAFALAALVAAVPLTIQFA